MTAPEKIWLGRDERYEGRPWRRLASQFDDEDGNETAEYTRSDLLPAQIAAAEKRGRIAGLREAAEIAHDHTPEKHSGMTLASHVTGRSIESAILARIPATQSDASLAAKREYLLLASYCGGDEGEECTDANLCAALRALAEGK